MTTFGFLGDLPADYAVERGQGGVLAVHADYRDCLRAAGFTPDGGEELAPSDVAGRQVLSEMKRGSERLLVRHFRHGGFFRWFVRERFGDPARPFQELRLARGLEEAGVRTPRVVAARARRATGFGWRLDLVTCRMERVQDAAEVLELMREGRVPWTARRRFFSALGALVGQLHRVGFLHADLTPRNILVGADLLDGGEVRPIVIDLDRSQQLTAIAANQRRANLERLFRAVRRREERGRRFLVRTDYRRFLLAYGQALGQSGESWRDDWRAILSLGRRDNFWHRLGWVFERIMGGGPETRDGRAVVRR